MAFEAILHSGSFNDYNGNEIEVTFYRRVDLNASPTSMTFASDGGTVNMSIWSRVGDAELGDPHVAWLHWGPATNVEKLVGCDYYKYTYAITCDPNNSGEDRSTELSVDIEGMGGVIINVPVIQYKAEQE